MWREEHIFGTHFGELKKELWQLQLPFHSQCQEKINFSLHRPRRMQMWAYFLTNKGISKLEHSRNKELGCERLRRMQEKKKSQ